MSHHRCHCHHSQVYTSAAAVILFIQTNAVAIVNVIEDIVMFLRMNIISYTHLRTEEFTEELIDSSTILLEHAKWMAGGG